MCLGSPPSLDHSDTQTFFFWLFFFFFWLTSSQLVDLRKDPLSASELLGDANPLGGILGAAFGQSAADVQARVEEASKNAKDLTGLVRKKKAKVDDADAANGNGKRKADDDESTELETKRTKVEGEEQAEK